jgi:RNA polymerase sigma-70 factor (ECF subfamily)
MLEIRGSHPEKTDEELLGQFMESGGIDVLGELYSRYMHLVYGVSLKYLGNREEAKDAVMQIFEKLLTELPRHRVQYFKSWLYVLTKNHCFMALRSKKSKDRSLEGYKSELQFMESEAELHPMDREDASPEDALKACMEKLNAEQRTCIELFYEQKMCYRDIAAHLGSEVKKVKSLLQNGKRNLKICLEEKDVHG